MENEDPIKEVDDANQAAVEEAKLPEEFDEETPVNSHINDTTNF